MDFVYYVVGAGDGDGAKTREDGREHTTEPCLHTEGYWSSGWRGAASGYGPYHQFIVADIAMLTLVNSWGSMLTSFISITVSTFLMRLIKPNSLHCRRELADWPGDAAHPIFFSN